MKGITTMRYDIVSITQRYRGMDRALTGREFYTQSTRKVYDDLFEKYLKYISVLCDEASLEESFFKIIEFCNEFKKYGVSCEPITYDSDPLTDAYGFELEFLGIDIVHDMCESLISNCNDKQLQNYFNENGLCKLETDIQEIVPQLDHGGVEWKPCYVYKVLYRKEQIIHLLNKSKQKVVVKANDTSVGTVVAGKSLCINVDASQTTHLTLWHEKDSYKKAGKAYMNIETTYELSEAVENVEYVITSDERYIDSGIYYHCLFLEQGGKTSKPVRYKVQGLEELKKAFANHSIKERLVDALLELLTEFIMVPIVTIVGAIVIVVWLGWKWLLIILLGLYLTSFIGEMFGEWFFNLIAKLVNKNYVNESMEQKIERLSQSEMIAEYYTNPDGS